MAECITGKQRGTCDSSECPTHGSCHCGCAMPCGLSFQNRTPGARHPDGLTRGRPFMYRSGHSPGSRKSRRPGYKHPESYHSVDEVRDVLTWLITEHGFNGAARASGVHRVTLYNIRQGRVQKVWPRTFKLLNKAWNRVNNPPTTAMVDLAPLRAYITREGYTLSSLNTTWQQRFHRGTCNIFAADEMATWFGVHPSAIWGEAWWNLDVEEDVAVSQ